MATPTVGLAFEFDESGSLNGLDYASRKSAFIDTFEALLPTDGSVAVQFDTYGTFVRSIFPLQTITLSTKAALIKAIQQLYQYGGSSASGTAIQKAANSLLSYQGLAATYIDVLADDPESISPFSSTASPRAVQTGISQVNILCSDTALDCAYNAGAGSVNLLVTNATFETSLQDLIASEIPIATPVPEPASLVLLSMGVAGVVAARRRRAK